MRIYVLDISSVVKTLFMVMWDVCHFSLIHCYALFHKDSLLSSDMPPFPDMPCDVTEGVSEIPRNRKLITYNHETEIIFALPTLCLDLKSTHYQGNEPPGPCGKTYCIKSLSVGEV